MLIHVDTLCMRTPNVVVVVVVVAAAAAAVVVVVVAAVAVAVVSAAVWGMLALHQHIAARNHTLKDTPMHTRASAESATAPQPSPVFLTP